jgi:hypothetical protein
LAAIRDAPFAAVSAAVNSLGERAEIAGRFSDTYVDVDLVGKLLQPKNQAIYGRRGTGKSHLLGRLKEVYQEQFGELKVLPVLIDCRAVDPGPGPSISSDPSIALLLAYRRLLDQVVMALHDLANDELTLSVWEKAWPRGSKKDRLSAVSEGLRELQTTVRRGEVEMTSGKASAEGLEQHNSKRSVSIGGGVGARMTADAKMAASLEAQLSGERSSSRTTDDVLRVAYEGLTVMNYPKIAGLLDDVNRATGAASIAILLDEWSSIEYDMQPLLAEMIRSTLAAGDRAIVVKIACIPYFTRLSTTRDSGQPLGLPVGEEIFVDVDFDRLQNQYISPEGVAWFLLRILARHLSIGLGDGEHHYMDLMQFLIDDAIEAPEVLGEMVRGSAGIPRDFMRIFIRAFEKATMHSASRQAREGSDGIPWVEAKCKITLMDARTAVGDYFQQEKRHGTADVTESSFEAFERIVNGICFKQSSDIFLVSQTHPRRRLLLELWHHRLIHMVAEGQVAFSEHGPETYDVYAIDFGRYVGMYGAKRGEQFAELMRGALGSVRNLLTAPLDRFWVLPAPEPSTGDALKPDTIKGTISAIASVLAPKRDMDEQVLEDCSALVADYVLSGPEVDG